MNSRRRANASDCKLSDGVNQNKDQIARFENRLRNRFPIQDLRAPQDYMDRDLDIVFDLLDERTMERFEAFASRIPCGSSRLAYPSCPYHSVHFPVAEGGARFEELVRLGPGKFSDQPQGVALPSFVRLKRANGGPKGFRKFVYYSPDLRRFKFTVAPRSWEPEARPEELHQSVELTGNRGENSVEPLWELTRYFRSSDHDLYERLGAVTLHLDEFGVEVLIDPNADVSIQVLGVFFGPFDYGSSLVQRSTEGMNNHELLPQTSNLDREDHCPGTDRVHPST